MPQLAPVSLAAIQRPLVGELDAVLAELRRIIAAEFPIVADVNRHLLQMRGKMFRPTLLLLSARATDEVGARDVRLAAVVELIHLATLVHDDSVDHSVLRRGQPTINALFSHQIAVIMGDYLYSRAIIELVELDDREPLRVISRVTNEMTVVEMRELVAHDTLGYSEAEYEELIHSKTASLMAAACEIGALRGGAAAREALRRYGLYLGMAFQITDDILDVVGTPEQLGKDVGKDEQRLTFVKLAGVDGARKLSDELVDTSVAAVANLGGAAQPLRDLAEMVRTRVGSGL